MNRAPAQISLAECDRLHGELKAAGYEEPDYGGPLGRHAMDGDVRLPHLVYDNSWAALRLWNFLLTEEDRLKAAREQGKKLVGTMKDLGTVPVMVYSLPNAVAFYPDGAWWIPCVMELSAGLLGIADSLGIDESFCPVRAMLGAFATGAHFPLPDLLTCSVGATCDDFSAIAQRLNGLGHPVLWWEIPHRREPEPGEEGVVLPGGVRAPREQVEFVLQELDRLRQAIEGLTGERLDDARLSEGIRVANGIRECLEELRRLAFTADICPMPALEMLIAEMLAIHFCSDREESLRVLSELLDEVRRRVALGVGPLSADRVRIFWVNPVADLRAMNLLEEVGGRICGTDFMFAHALDRIPEDVPPMEALARAALADPMVGDVAQRAERICQDAREVGSEAVVVSRIPGGSHCAFEGALIADVVRRELDLPVMEVEVPPVTDALATKVGIRLEGVIETALSRRASG